MAPLYTLRRRTGPSDRIGATGTDVDNLRFGFVTLDLSHQVDYIDFSYVLQWYATVAGSSMQLCGVRIAYTPPALFSDGFETGSANAWSSSVP